MAAAHPTLHGEDTPSCTADACPDRQVLEQQSRCYDPLAFTHQKAYWTDDIDREETVRFAQTGVTPAYFEGIFASAAEMAARHDTALYCGEYGVIDKADPADTLAWYRAIHAAFEKMGIARCAWSYKGVDFGLCDPRLDAFREEIVKNL